MATIITDEQDYSTIKLIFAQNFSNNEEEVSAALYKARYKGFNYASRILFGLRETSEEKAANLENLIVAAAICMPRTVDNFNTLEVIWFATDESTRKRGYGSRLFESIMEYSKKNKLKAVLCTSTNKAASWWLSRPFHIPNLTACKFVLRSENRINIEKVSFTDNPGENEKYMDTITSVQKNLGISFVPIPKTKNFELLYCDKVLRSRKGKLLKGQTFRGNPYRYSIEESNHIWFLNDIQLVNTLGTQPFQNCHTVA